MKNKAVILHFLNWLVKR